MRITNNILQRNSLASLQVNARQLEKAQRRVTTGLRLEVASDDPVSATAVMTSQSSIRALEQYRRNVDGARSRANAEESALENLNDILSKALELALQQGDASSGSDTRGTAAIEVGELYNQAVQIANMEFGGSYLFGGYGASTEPVSVDGSGNATVGAGAVGQREVEVSTGLRLRSNHNATEVFTDSGVFTALGNLRTALQNNDQDAIIASVTGIRSAVDGVQANTGELGAWSSQLDVTEANLDALEVNLRTFTADLTEVDLEEAVTDMVARQTSYQAAMLATSRVMGMTLADYLR